jgi:hypothetical protein
MDTRRSVGEVGILRMLSPISSKVLDQILLESGDKISPGMQAHVDPVKRGLEYPPVRFTMWYYAGIRTVVRPCKRR